ncbi:hypothetical protein [Arthrobacter globiformis]|uniref:hypothetical protein n=1 Tax=Arthrobacter globiformis TaxID=1665 RepID=UPI002792807A|nr:hypothetical protein [Arthrobacter globiformis]MDQ0617407.1 hypothetical protein [Arthrobacter globiformis]
MMQEDVDEARDALTGKWVSDEDETKALRRVEKWAARDESHRSRTGYDGTDYLDKFLLLLKTRIVSVSGVRTAGVEQMMNVFDLYHDELGGARLSEFKRLVALSRRQATSGRTSERPESALSFVSKREALGAMGMVKGLSTSAAGLVDLGAWALGVDVSGGGLAGEVAKGWDEMGGAAADAMGVDVGEEAVLGQSSFAVGDIGGKVIGALTTAGALTGASVSVQVGMATVQTAKGVDDLAVALRTLRRGPPPLAWSEIAGRPDVWAKVVGVVANAAEMAGSMNATNSAVKDVCEKLGIVLGAGQGVILVAAYQAVDQDPASTSPAERSQRKAELLAEIVSTAALTIDGRYGEPFRKLWEANHSAVHVDGPRSAPPPVPGSSDLVTPMAREPVPGKPAETAPQTTSHLAPPSHGPPALGSLPVVAVPGPKQPDSYAVTSVRKLKSLVKKKDKMAAEALAIRYEGWSTTRKGLSRLRRAMANGDQIAKQVWENRLPENTKLAAYVGKKGDERPIPHEATVKVTDSQGKVTWHPKPFRSGEMTSEQKKLGYPKAQESTHTEIKAIAEAPLNAGDTLWISGQYDPCDPCQKAMIRASEGGRTVDYWWQWGTFRAVDGRVVAHSRRPDNGPEEGVNPSL